MKSFSIYTEEDMYTIRDEGGYVTATRNDRNVGHVLRFTMEEFTERLTGKERVDVLREEFE